MPTNIKSVDEIVFVVLKFDKLKLLYSKRIICNKVANKLKNDQTNIYIVIKKIGFNKFNLFYFLRKLDKFSKQRIVVAPIPNKGIGKTINERLKRAAL